MSVLDFIAIHLIIKLFQSVAKNAELILPRALV